MNSTSLFIPRLPLETTQAQLEELLMTFPGFKSCRVRQGKKELDALIGFAEFISPEEANECREQSGKLFIQGVKILFEFVLQGKPPSSISTVHVSLLPPDTTERELGHLFRPFTGYVSMRLHSRKHPELNKRIYAFVEFDSHENAAGCVKAMAGYLFSEDDDEPISVELARTMGYETKNIVVRTRN